MTNRQCPECTREYGAHAKNCPNYGKKEPSTAATSSTQKTLLEILDEIEAEKLNSTQDLHRLILQHAALVKALRRARTYVTCPELLFDNEITAILTNAGNKPDLDLKEP